MLDKTVFQLTKLINCLKSDVNDTILDKIAEKSHSYNGFAFNVRRKILDTCDPILIELCYVSSGVSRISFRRGVQIFLEKRGNLHGAKRHATRGEATRLLGGFGGMLPRENFKKWSNLVRFREHFAKILSKKIY